MRETPGRDGEEVPDTVDKHVREEPGTAAREAREITVSSTR